MPRPLSQIHTNASARIWALSLLALGASMAGWLVLPDSAWPEGQLRWWMLAPAFLVVEVAVVHIQFRTEAYSFSLAEIPFLVGLVYSSASDLVIAQIVGSALALHFVRRQTPIKLAFNLANYAANTTLALLAFRLLQSGDGIFDWRSWPAFYATSFAAAVLNVALIATAITVSEGRPDLAKTIHVALFGFVVAGTNTSLALSGILVVDTQPAAIILLSSVAVTLVVAYRAYASERHHHESLEFLYQSTMAMHSSAEWEDAIRALLVNACAAFRADTAELVLFGESAEIPSLRSTHVVSQNRFDPLVGIDDHDDAAARLLSTRLDGAVIVQGDNAGSVAKEYFASRSFTGGLVTRLQGEERIVGLLTVANRTSDVTGFSNADLRLFETVAANAALSLENDQLEQSIAQLTELETKLTHQAFHDSLTGLANRRRFSELVGDRLDTGGETTVLFIDLDDFKIVNDGLGHAAGDTVLTTIASRIRRCLRPNDVAARLGGDEFAVLIEGSAADAQQVAARLIEAISDPVSLDGETARVGASVGLAAAAVDTTVDALLRSADTAMYVAKAEGKGTVRQFSDDMFDVIADRRRLQVELASAIDSDEIRVHLQPIIDLASGRPVAAEALVRWMHPTRGLLTAGEFITVAEQGGLATRMGTEVLRGTLEAAASFAEAGHRLPVTVNVSGRQLADSTITSDIASALRDSDLDPRMLIVEITETAVTADITANIDRLHALRDLGVTLALDDFGTGHSSLGHLRRFPIDILKIAKEFVDHLGEHERDDLFVKAIIDLGHVLGMSVVAEGIEREHQAHVLRQLGCDQGQGFLFSPALPPADLLGFLVANATPQL